MKNGSLNAALATDRSRRTTSQAFCAAMMRLAPVKEKKQEKQEQAEKN